MMSIQNLRQWLGSKSLLFRLPTFILFIATLAVPLTIFIVAGDSIDRLYQRWSSWNYLPIPLMLFVGFIIGYRRLRYRSRKLSVGNNDSSMRMPRKRILWVEGDEDQREVVNFILVQSGYSITSVDNSLVALSLAKIEHFDLYLLGDWEPFGKESRLCEQLNQLIPQHPVLFYSSAAEPTDRLRGLGAGAQNYLTKLVGLDTLREAIIQTLNSNRKLVENK